MGGEVFPVIKAETFLLLTPEAALTLLRYNGNGRFVHHDKKGKKNKSSQGQCQNN